MHFAASICQLYYGAVQECKYSLLSSYFWKWWRFGTQISQIFNLFKVIIFRQPEYRANGAFALPTGKTEITIAKWNEIPDDTDILVSHGPPFGIGDLCKSSLRVGCPMLLSAVQERVKPKIHAFGHIHEGITKFLLWNLWMNIPFSKLCLVKSSAAWR